MKITNSLHVNQINHKQKNKTSREHYTESPEVNFGNTNYSKIAFKAMVGVKNKKIDIDVEKNKILKQMVELKKSCVVFEWNLVRDNFPFVILVLLVSLVLLRNKIELVTQLYFVL